MKRETIDVLEWLTESVSAKKRTRRAMKTNTNKISRRSDAGFTLVEMMMSVLIFGVVIGIISNVFFSTSRVYTRTTQRAAQQMSARASLGVMVEEIRHAGADALDENIVAITVASGSQIQINAELNDISGLQTVEPSEIVTYRYDAAESILYRNPGTGEMVLLSDIEAFAFRYFDSNNNELGPLPLTPALAGLVQSVEINVATESSAGTNMNFSTRVGFRNK